MEGEGGDVRWEDGGGVRWGGGDLCGEVGSGFQEVGYRV